MSVFLWFAVASLVAWVYLAVGHGRFWRTDVRLPRPAPAPEAWPQVVVVIPARDEATVLPEALPSVLAQDYPGVARVILVDDGSSDGTGALAKELGAAATARLTLTVASPGDPPPGWTGKLWALHHGVGQAGETELLLFTDADIAHGPTVLRDLVAAMGERDMVSLMAHLRVRTGWERLIVPAFVYLFAQLYPFRWVNSARMPVAAAAGGCVLIRRSALERAGGLEAVSGAVIDDVSLARAVKRSDGRIWLGLAETGPTNRVRSVRPYPRLADLWHMVARSAYTQLRHSVVLLTGTIAGLAFTYLLPPAALVAGAATGDVPLLLVGAAAWALMTATYIPMLRYYGRPVAAALLLPATVALYGGMTLDSARRHWRGRGATWKSRSYGAVAARKPTQESDPS